MKIKGEGVFCDYCMVQFEEDANGRLFAGRKTVKGFRGPVGVLKFAVKALFGVLLCEDCDQAIKRKPAPAIPMNHEMRKYLRDVETAKRPAPWKSCAVRNKNGNRMCTPVTLNAAGKPSPGAKK